MAICLHFALPWTQPPGPVLQGFMLMAVLSATAAAATLASAQPANNKASQAPALKVAQAAPGTSAAAWGLLRQSLRRPQRSQQAALGITGRHSLRSPLPAPAPAANSGRGVRRLAASRAKRCLAACLPPVALRGNIPGAWVRASAPPPAAKPPATCKHVPHRQHHGRLDLHAQQQPAAVHGDQRALPPPASTAMRWWPADRRYRRRLAVSGSASMAGFFTIRWRRPAVSGSLGLDYGLFLKPRAVSRPTRCGCLWLPPGSGRRRSGSRGCRATGIGQISRDLGSWLDARLIPACPT